MMDLANAGKPAASKSRPRPGSAPQQQLDKLHAADIGHWLTVLKHDKRAIFTAAGHACRAAEYLHGFGDGQAVAAA